MLPHCFLCWCLCQEALQWLEGYMPEDLCIAQLKGSSNSLWTISPPSRNSLIDMLNSGEEFLITVSWSVQRYARTKRYSTHFCLVTSVIVYIRIVL